MSQTDEPNARYQNWQYLDQVFTFLSRPGPYQTSPDRGPAQLSSLGGVGGTRHLEYSRARDDEQPELRCPVCGHRDCPLDVGGRL